MNPTMDDISLLRQAERHHLVVREIGEEIDLEIGPGDDDPTFATSALGNLTSQPPTHLVEDHEDHKHILLVSQDEQSVAAKLSHAKRKRKVVKKWREEWADTYKWAYVDVNEGTARIFCSVCREYGRKHRRNPYGNEGSRNMQMSALEEHNNSLLHKEALRLQAASKDKNQLVVERPVRAKALMSKTASSIIEAVIRRDPHEIEFIQSVQEAVHSLEPVLIKNAQYVHILERLLEPDRTIVFRVSWMDDKGETHVNRGFRVQFNQALGPCRGGLRFHPSMTLSIAKFLGFEQIAAKKKITIDDLKKLLSLEFDMKDLGATKMILMIEIIRHRAKGKLFLSQKNYIEKVLMRFGMSTTKPTMKNALSPYKLGGAGGGSDFDPRGKSENEIMHFCQSFMDELHRYLGPDRDLPAEDIGVGPREMGYLFGQYKRLAGNFQGSFIGPKIFWSGSSLRTEATGYGLVFFARLILAEMNKELKGLRCVVSGAGKIAMHVLEKLFTCGAIPVTLSDSRGYLFDEDGFDFVKFSLLRDIKVQQRSLRDYVKSYSRAKYVEDAKPWSEQCDIVFPCASQNEIDQNDAIALVHSGCQLVIEGSSMSCTPQAIDVLRKAKVLVAPSKAASAGGVAVRELELNHDYNLLHFSAEDFETKLQESMKQTYERSIKAASDYGFLKDNPETLVHGGTICAFLNLVQAMSDQGCV